MSAKREYPYQGKIYTSINQLAIAYGVSANKIYWFVNSGRGDYIAAMNYYTTPQDEYIINGKKFSTIKEIANEIGVRVKTFYSYMSNQQCTVEEAYHHYTDTQYSYKGKKYKSLAEIARDYGINPGTFSNYIALTNSTIDTAIKHFLREKPQTIADIAKECGVGYSTFYGRLNRSGMNVDEAKKYKKPTYEFDGKIYKSQKAMLEDNHVSAGAYYNERKRGGDLTTLLKKKNSCRIIIEGKEFVSYKEYCRQNALNYTSFKYHKQNFKKLGVDEKEAIKLAIKKIKNGSETTDGENQIISILKRKNINCIRNRSFRSLLEGSNVEINKRIADVWRLRPDFVLTNYNGFPLLVIEFDGQQHFRWEHFGSTKEEFAQLRNRDIRKNNFMRNMKIPFVRIKYDQDIQQVVQDFLENTEQYIDSFNPVLTEQEYYEYDKITIDESGSCTQLVFDHLGNAFPTIKAMCQFWRIGDKTYAYRRKLGQSVEEALTTPVTKKKWVDHLGNEYSNLREMANKYAIGFNILQNRVYNNWPIERALLTPVRQPPESIVFRGEFFSCVSELAKKYQIDASVLVYRISAWGDIERAVSEPVKKIKKRKKKINQ